VKLLRTQALLRSAITHTWATVSESQKQVEFGGC